jgi:hypothetical protein
MWEANHIWLFAEADAPAHYLDRSLHQTETQARSIIQIFHLPGLLSVIFVPVYGNQTGLRRGTIFYPSGRLDLLCLQVVSMILYAIMIVRLIHYKFQE